jgi:hypothetical protein
MRTDEQEDVTKLTVAFRNFANVPKRTIHKIKYGDWQTVRMEGCGCMQSVVGKGFPFSTVAHCVRV